MIADAVGAILLAVITLYATLGGADFGGGLWDQPPGGDRRGRAPRELIDETITPAWEGNNVWLIFALVIFWTAFHDAFAADDRVHGRHPAHSALPGGAIGASIRRRCSPSRAAPTCSTSYP